MAIACRRQITHSLSLVYADKEARQLFVQLHDKLNNRLLLTALYFPSDGVAARKQFMCELDLELLKQSYVIGTDTNLTTSSEERWPARATRSDGKMFLDMLTLTDLVDVGAASTSPPSFTFHHRNGTNASTLDRLLMARQFSMDIQRFQVLDFSLSDHDAVFIQLVDDGTGDRLPARTPTLMLADDVCCDVVKLSLIHI